MPSIHIINPAASAPGYYTGEAFADEQGGWTQVADLAIVTVAAMVPAGWDIRVTDEAISPLDLETAADFVAITGKVSQRLRMTELAAEFRRRGSTVLIGGSFASLSPEVMRPHADILVTGELEGLAPSLFADLESGIWAARYDGGQADMRLSPVPRWDLYPLGRAFAGALQTTRGCPFNCEFCDVIQYQGRKQRHKRIDQVLAELEALYACGVRNVFLVDDNFTAYRRWAREVLDALTVWNAAHAGDPVRFMTQASLDIARDTDLLDRCRTAGLRTLFVGVETINEDSLRETGKRQNLLLPMAESFARIVSKGIVIRAGLIVGFDHDGPGIFQEMLDFLQGSPIPDLSLGVLTAPAATDLYRRLVREGRLAEGAGEAAASSPFETNIQPARMSRHTLLEGARALGHQLYSPARYQQRVMNLIEAYGGDEATSRKAHGSAPRAAGRRHTLEVVRRISSRGRAEADMVGAVLRRASAKPAVLPSVMDFLLRYEQARCVMDYADQVAERAAPAIVNAA